MTEPSSLIKINVDGLAGCQSSPTSTGLPAVAGGMALPEDAGDAGELVVGADPQAPTSSMRAAAEAKRIVIMTPSPGQLCRSIQTFELALCRLNASVAGRLLTQRTNWFPEKDSNLRSRIQSPLPYRLAIRD
jgi:hypothetical protein